jgi:SAM-dependent methyltransferase
MTLRPSSAGDVRTRAVRIAPARVASVVPIDLNVVLERLEPLPTREQFDVVVATSVLVYYDVFEQELALVNIGRMLRTGGVLLTNTPVPPTSGMKLSDRYTTVVYSERQRDQVFWYERQ